MKSTVLITGAGASMPYGFPSGSQLRDAILGYWQMPYIAGFDPAGAQNPVRQAHGRKADLLDDPLFSEFRQQLQRQELSSVDRFLEHPRNARFQEVGLVATAMVIGGCHSASHHYYQLRSDQWHSHWYRALLNFLDNGDDNFYGKEVKVITFNYDVSLETYLCQVISSRSETPFHKIWERLKSAYGFLHLYGDVSSPWDDEYSAYYCDDALAWSRDAATRLKIISQARDDEPAFLRAQEWIAESEVVLFYGFGYDHTNMKRLGVLPGSPILEGKEVMGTHVNMSAPPSHIQKLNNNAHTFTDVLSGL